MNPFFFVKYQSHSGLNRPNPERKNLVRQDLENRNQGLYSWNQQLSYRKRSGPFEPSAFLYISPERLISLIKTDWPLILAILLLLTGLSLVSLQIFIVVMTLVTIGITLILGQNLNYVRLRQNLSPAYSTTSSLAEPEETSQPEKTLQEATTLYQQTAPRFIPLSHGANPHTTKRPQPRHYQRGGDSKNQTHSSQYIYFLGKLSVQLRMKMTLCLVPQKVIQLEQRPY